MWLSIPVGFYEKKKQKQIKNIPTKESSFWGSKASYPLNLKHIIFKCIKDTKKIIIIIKSCKYTGYDHVCFGTK